MQVAEPRLRLAYFAPTYPGITGEGGIGSYTRDLARTLGEWGHEVHVLTPGTSRSVVRDGSVSIHVMPPPRLWFMDRLFPGAGMCWRVYREMSRLVRRHQIQLVEFPNWEGFGSLFGRRRQVPVVVRLSTSSLETQSIDGVAPSRLASWDVRRERWLAHAADALVTHSEAHRRRMAAELGVATSRIALSPHGVPVFRDFVRSPRRSEELTVVFLGRMERRKGTFDLLHAIPEVVQQVPDVRFVFIGSDRPHCPGGLTHVEYFQANFPQAIRDRVSFAGRLTDEQVDARLQAADLFIAPSLYESFGLIFLEAMRWGTPVVGTRVGGIPEIITDGETGMLVPPENPPALAARVIDLLRDEPRRLALGRAGRRRVEEAFSVEQMSHRAASLYAQTIGTRRGMRFVERAGAVATSEAVPVMAR